jgi:GntR family transcriptional regulator, transcriptional repressor for pyruvate dehydrogenase complex
VSPGRSSHIARGQGVYRGRGPRAGMLVADYLRQQIVEGSLQDGDDLPSEAVLMKQFTVSRPTLREALRVLESEGLLTVRRGSVGGFRVHAPDPKVAAQFAGRVLQHRGATLADIRQARIMFEPQCARLVAEHRTKSQLERLRECLQAGVDEVDANGVGPVSSHRTFHELIVELAGNETMMLMSSMFRHMLHEDDGESGTAAEGSIDKRRIRRADKEHQILVDLIEVRDGEGAERFWTRHLNKGDD